MKKYQHTLLAGVAALALVAGIGVASAQQSNEHMGGAGGAKAASPQAGQSMNRGGGMQSQAQEKGKATETQAQEKGKATETQAQEKGKTDQTAQTRDMGKRGEKTNRQAEHRSKNGRQNTAEQQRTLKGLRGDTTKPMQNESQQGSEGKGKTSNSAKKGNTSNPAQKGTASERTEKGNTADQAQKGNPSNETRGTGANQGAQANGGARVQGANVQITEQQRTQIRQTIIDSHSAPRVSHVDFDVRVGTVVPRGSIHFVPVPETLVRIEPRWRGYEYFVYEDEVVIIDPSNMTIVVIINA
jgi:hypothetical protein